MQAPIKRRGLADTIGFAHLDRQMDALMQRIDREDATTQERVLREMSVSGNEGWRMAIAPHDDYAYAGSLYPLAMANIKARTVIVFGVAHKASACTESIPSSPKRSASSSSSPLI